MSVKLSASDIQGISRLAISATAGVADIVEAMHQTIASLSSRPDPEARTAGITGLVYRCVQGVTKVIGGTLDVALASLSGIEQPGASSDEREALLAILNGVLGDHLVATRNSLAIPMVLRCHEMRERSSGQPGDPTDRPAPPPVTGKLLVLVHGLCMNDRQWLRDGHDHGAALSRDLGYTPLYLHYNSGLHISTNGQAFADLLEETLAAWPMPVQELVIIGHSMGGLLTRSACHVAESAGHSWPRNLRKIIFLGTPHHGAPLERGGNWINVALLETPYTAPLARLGHIRSAGITDLRYGYLLDEDWAGDDRFEAGPDARHALPLPADVQCYAAAALLGEHPDATKSKVLGDGIVPLASALGHHQRPEVRLAIPEPRQWIGTSMNHLELLCRPEVYERVRTWVLQ